jgi:hypothetical protein
MFRRFACVFALVLITGATGCARFPIGGGLYTGVSQPVSATAQLSMKRGEACSMSVLGLIATGDASIEAARKAGGIRSISTVDEQVTVILMGLYASACTVVHGK